MVTRSGPRAVASTSVREVGVMRPGAVTSTKDKVALRVSPPRIPVAPAPTCAVVECAPLTAIQWAAVRWGASDAALVAVAQCESGLNPHAYNASGPSGLFQFL